MREKPPIAKLVKKLRTRARLSQRRLAGLSGTVSDSTIARIEHGFDRKTGGPVKPEPETLRGIARGLASSDDGEIDEARAVELYRELLEVAGYTSLILDTPATNSEAVSSERAPGARDEGGNSVEREIASLLARIPDASIALTDLARGSGEWGDDDREFVLGQLRLLARRYGQSREAC